MSSHPLMVNPRQAIRAVLFAFSLSLLLAASVFRADAQDFALTAPNGLDTPAVNPGGVSTANLSLQATGGFAGSVSLTCAVITTNQGVSCLVSPSSAAPPAQPSLTVTTSQSTLAGSYQITVTGTSGSIINSVTLTLGVTPLTEDYTLSVSPTTATPSPVNAGMTATSVVTVTPIGSYTGNVTLACLSVSDIVFAAPYCSFQYAGGNQYVQVANGAPATATITITTLGPTPVTTLWTPRAFSALWLAVPGLALLVAGGAGRRRSRLMGLFLLIGLASALLLMPACSSTNNTNNPSGLTTPTGSYTFTLTGADQSGNGPSNIATNPATVSLTVNN